MKRGEIWTLLDKHYASKARPVVVIQSDKHNSCVHLKGVRPCVGGRRNVCSERDTPLKKNSNSDYRKIVSDLVCPVCGNKQQFDVYQRIIVPDDNDLKDKLLSRSLFQDVCKKCGFEIKLGLECTYLDSKKQTLIRAFPDNMEVDSAQYLEEMKTFGKKSDKDSRRAIENLLFAGYTKRLVFNMDFLREKVILLENGFDDRIFELVKIFVERSFNSENKEKAHRIYLDELENDLFVFQIIAGKKGDFSYNTTIVPVSHYEMLKDAYEDRLLKASDDRYIRTDVWAKKSGLPEEGRFGIMTGRAEGIAQAKENLEKMAEKAEARIGSKSLSEQELLDVLYESALQFRKMKLWEMLDNTRIFGVKHYDKTTSYVSVLGNGGQVYGMALYQGAEGIRRLLDINEDPPLFKREWEEHEYYLDRTALTLSFDAMADLDEEQQKRLRDYCKRNGVRLAGRNACPHFEKHEPFHIPAPIKNRADIVYMIDALQTAMFIGRDIEAFGEQENFKSQLEVLASLGIHFGYDKKAVVLTFFVEDHENKASFEELPELPRLNYPKMEFSPVQIKKLKRAKKRSGRWNAGIFLGSILIDENSGKKSDNDVSGQTPYFPWYLCFESTGNNPFVCYAVGGLEDYPEAFAEKLFKYMETIGVPSEIFVENERTKMFFSGIASQLGIGVKKRFEIPSLDDNIRTMFRHEPVFNPDQMKEALDRKEIESKDVSNEAMSKIFNSELQSLFKALADPALVRSFPDEFIVMMHEVLGAGQTQDYPENMVTVVEDEYKRRERLSKQ